MKWMEVMFGVPEAQKPTAVESEQKFLEITLDYDLSREYYPAEDFTPHLPDVHTLIIQRHGLRAPIAHYGPRGWVRFRWVMRRPSEVEHGRADKHL